MEEPIHSCPLWFPGPKEKDQNDGHEPFGSDHGCLVQRNQGGTCVLGKHTAARPAPFSPRRTARTSSTITRSRTSAVFSRNASFSCKDSPFSGVDTTILFVPDAQARFNVFDDFDDFKTLVCTQESSSWPLMTQGAAGEGGRLLGMSLQKMRILTSLSHTLYETSERGRSASEDNPWKIKKINMRSWEGNSLLIIPLLHLYTSWRMWHKLMSSPCCPEVYKSQHKV